MEFALVLPVLVVLLFVLVHAAVLGRDLVVAQWAAREAARTAAVDGDAAARAAAERASPDRPVEVELRPPAGARGPDDWVRADLRLRSAAFAAFGVELWLPATAVLRVEAQ